MPPFAPTGGPPTWVALVGIIVSLLVLCAAGSLVWRATSRRGGSGGSVGQEIGAAPSSSTTALTDGGGTSPAPQKRRQAERQRAHQEARRRNPQTFAALEALAHANAQQSEQTYSSYVPPTATAVLAPIEPGSAREALSEHAI